MRFLDVKTDFAFKKVFGSEESKEILISFLNAVIYLDSPRRIKEVTIVDPYSIPLLKGMKDTYVDVKARLDDGTSVIIEMQVLNHPGFEKRILYNAAKNYSVQLKKGEDYTLLNPVIALTLVDFSMFDSTEKLITRFKLIEKEAFIEYNDDIELIFVELPKFNKQESDLQDIRDKWIYFVKNAGTLDYVPKEMGSELNKAFEIINEANLSETELEAQYKRKEFIYIQKSSIQQAEQKGVEKGIKQVAKKMLQSGITMETVIQSTGLSRDELDKL